MSQDSELLRLERFVEKMLVNFSELRAEKSSLLKQLRERDLEIEALRSNVSAQEMERGEISQRVGKLVEQIEEWENSLDEEMPVSPKSSGQEDEEIEGNDLDTDDVEDVEDVAEVEDVEETILAEDEEQEEIAEVIAESSAGEEVRVQHNLFSLKGSHR